MSSKCDERVSNGIWSMKSCDRPVKEAGKCGIHSPSAVAKRRAKSAALYESYKEKSPWTKIERLEKRIEDMEETLAVQLALVHKQAGDEGLWFIAQTAPEAYLQQELRRLHGAIEANAASLGDE